MAQKKKSSAKAKAKSPAKKKTAVKKKATAKKAPAKKKTAVKQTVKKTAKKTAVKKTSKKTAVKKTAQKPAVKKKQAPKAAAAPVEDETVEESASLPYSAPPANPFPFEPPKKSVNYRLLFGLGIVAVLVLFFIFREYNRKKNEMAEPVITAPAGQSQEAGKADPPAEEQPAAQEETPAESGDYKQVKKSKDTLLECKDGLESECRLTRLNDAGKVIAVEGWAGRKLEGLTTLYYNDGKTVKSRRYWKEHKRHGSLINYNEKGAEELNCTYEEGKKTAGPATCPAGAPNIPLLK